MHFAVGNADKRVDTTHARRAACTSSPRLCGGETPPKGTVKGRDRWWYSLVRARRGRDPRRWDRGGKRAGRCGLRPLESRKYAPVAELVGIGQSGSRQIGA